MRRRKRNRGRLHDPDPSRQLPEGEGLGALRWKRRYIVTQKAVTRLAKSALKTRDPKVYKQTLTVLADSGDLAALLLNEGETTS